MADPTPAASSEHGAVAGATTVPDARARRRLVETVIEEKAELAVRELAEPKHPGDVFKRSANRVSVGAAHVVASPVEFLEEDLEERLRAAQLVSLVGRIEGGKDLQKGGHVLLAAIDHRVLRIRLVRDPRDRSVLVRHTLQALAGPQEG